MRKLAFIFIFYWLYQNLNAQAFSVGNTCCNYNLVNKTFSTATSPPFPGPPFYSSSDGYSIDIDGDFTTDISISSSFGFQTPPSGNTLKSIRVTSTTGVEFVYTPIVSGWYNQSVANLLFGTVLNNSLNWKLTPATYSMGTAAPVVYEHYNKYSPSFSYTVGTQISPFYIGFRKILPSNDTVYGWTRMDSNFPGKVIDYAYTCQNTTSAPTSSFVTVPTAICVGDSLSLNANPSGGQFSGTGVVGNLFKSKSLSQGSYSVYYTMPNPGGCTISSILTLTVNPLPTISLFNWLYNICENDTLTINPYPIGSPFVYTGVGLGGNNFYAALAGIGAHTVGISLTDVNSCTKTSYLNINVNSCVGINEFSAEINHFQIFPSPNNGEFEIKGTKEETIFISNELGQLISTKILTQENNYSVKLNNLQSGIYFVGNKFYRQKVVVIK